MRDIGPSHFECNLCNKRILVAFSDAPLAFSVRERDGGIERVVTVAGVEVHCCAVDRDRLAESWGDRALGGQELAVGNNTPAIDACQIVPMLGQDVVIHTWDLAHSVGVDDHLHERLCLVRLEQLPADDRLASFDKSIDRATTVIRIEPGR